MSLPLSPTPSQLSTVPPASGSGLPGTTSLEDALRHAQPKLLGLIRRRMTPFLRKRVDPHDVLQEVLLKAYRRREQFSSQEEACWMGWLGSITRNELRDQEKFHRRDRRDAQREVALGDAEAVQVTPAAGSPAARAIRITLDRALRALPDDHRKAVLLRSFGELSFREIGSHLGRSPDAARMLHGRALEGLSAQLL